jgi:hypothetical protein
VLIYQNEAKSLADAGAPGSSESEIPASLKPMHETYRKAMTKLESDRDKLSAPAFAAYVKALDQYVAELTKAGRIEAAKQVDGVRETLGQTRSEMQATGAKAPSAGS